jgi:hypothetical protein
MLSYVFARVRVCSDLHRVVCMLIVQIELRAFNTPDFPYSQSQLTTLSPPHISFNPIKPRPVIRPQTALPQRVRGHRHLASGARSGVSGGCVYQRWSRVLHRALLRLVVNHSSILFRIVAIAIAVIVTFRCSEGILMSAKRPVGWGDDTLKIMPSSHRTAHCLTPLILSHYGASPCLIPLSLSLLLSPHHTR